MSAPTTGQPADIPDHLPAIAPPIGPAVDVLAVMDECTDQLEAQPGCYYTDAAELQEARAAVAELIEADKEYDEADLAWENAPGGVQAVGDTDGRDYDGPEFLRLMLAVKRRRAALARVGGAA